MGHLPTPGIDSWASVTLHPSPCVQISVPTGLWKGSIPVLVQARTDLIDKVSGQLQTKTPNELLRVIPAVAHILTSYLISYLTYILDYSGMLSDILSHIYSALLSDILSANIFWDSIWQIFRHMFWHFIWNIFSHSIWYVFWHFVWHSSLHSIWHFISYSMWNIFRHSIWHMFWHFIWHSIWHILIQTQIPCSIVKSSNLAGLYNPLVFALSGIDGHRQTNLKPVLISYIPGGWTKFWLESQILIPKAPDLCGEKPCSSTIFHGGISIFDDIFHHLFMAKSGQFAVFLRRVAWWRNPYRMGSPS